MVGGSLKEILDPGNPVNLPQFAQRHPFKRRISEAVAMVKDLLGSCIGKRANHA
jgi:hypothetical protein